MTVTVAARRGLRVLVEEGPFAKTAGVLTIIRGGSGDDPEGAEGLSHLVEHLTYRAIDPPRKVRRR